MNMDTSTTAKRVLSDKHRLTSASQTVGAGSRNSPSGDRDRDLQVDLLYSSRQRQINLDEGFFDRDLPVEEEDNIVTLPDRIDSPIDTRATEVSLSSSWLSLSGGGSGQSSSGSSRRPSPNPFSEEGSEGVGIGMGGGSWIDAEIGSEGRSGGGGGEMGMGSTGRYGEKEEEMSSIDKVNAWFRPGDPDRGRKLGDVRGDDQGDGEVDGGDDSGHNSNLVFPRLDASVGPGTDSYDTIKAFKSNTTNATMTRFDRSFSQSTVRLTSSASHATPCQTELHKSFLSDLADPEGSAKYHNDDDHPYDDDDDVFRLGSGVEVQSDVISSSDPPGSVRGEDEWDLGEVEDQLQAVGTRGGRGPQGTWVGSHGEEEGGINPDVGSDEQFVTDLPKYATSVDGSPLSFRGSRPSEKDKVIAKYWMEKVARGVEGGANDTLAWNNAARIVAEQPDQRVERYDQMKRITLLIIPFVTLTVIALMSGAPIERMLFPTRPDVTLYSPVASSPPAVTRVADMGAQHARPMARSESRESTALVLVGKVGTDAQRSFKEAPLQTVVSGKNAVVSPRLEAVRMRMDRLAQIIPNHLPSLNIAGYHDALHLAGKQAQRAIHKASVALIGAMMHIPRGLTQARASFGLWLDPKLKQTTDMVVADGKAAWSLVAMGAQKGFDKTSENVARALSDFKTSSIRRTNQIVTGVCGLGQTAMNARHLASERIAMTFGRIRSAQLALAKASVARGNSASAQITGKFQDASSNLRNRLRRYAEGTKSRMASIKTRRSHSARPRANRKNTAHHEKNKRWGPRQ